jgi:quercetin dioxygenase-like cupin family protein
MMAAHKAAHISDIPSPVETEAGSYDWRPIRHHFDVRSFGVNLNIAPAAGDWVIGEHTEIEASATRHEELFFVSAGHASFEVDGEPIDAPAGTFVFVPDPGVRRSARALEPGTTVLAIGGEPGVAFSVSDWEKEYFVDD